MTKPYFLLLMIRDELIVNLINSIYITLCNKEPKLNPHITLRGPYRSTKDDFKPELMRIINQFDLSGCSIKIEGADLFNNQGKIFAYLRAKALWLNDVWRKSDYPKSRFGINPHITIYEGSDFEYAKSVVSLINDFNLQIQCSKLEFYIHPGIKENISADFLSLGEDSQALVSRLRLLNEA